MNPKIIIVISIVVLTGAFLLFASAPAKDHLVGLVTFATDERQCFNLYKEDFYDPATAYVEESFVWTKAKEEQMSKPSLRNPLYYKYDTVLNVKVHAKNRMGGYVVNWLVCPLLNGRFDRHTVEMYRIDEDMKNLRK